MPLSLGIRPCGSGCIKSTIQHSTSALPLQRYARLCYCTPMTTRGFDYDLIIAGRIVCRIGRCPPPDRVRDRVLLIDEHAIGAVRHSACAVPTQALADVGGLRRGVPGDLVRRHPHEAQYGALPLARAVDDLRSPRPVCEQSGSKRRKSRSSRRASPASTAPQSRRTRAGSLPLFVDGRGWRAALAAWLAPGFRGPRPVDRRDGSHRARSATRCTSTRQGDRPLGLRLGLPVRGRAAHRVGRV